LLTRFRNFIAFLMAALRLPTILVAIGASRQDLRLAIAPLFVV